MHCIEAYVIITLTCSVWEIDAHIGVIETGMKGLFLHVSVLSYLHTHLSTLSVKGIN